MRKAGLFLRVINHLNPMIEVIIPVVLAAITGGSVMFTRIHNKIHDLDRRVDGVELRVAESYVSKADFNNALDRMEGHLVRIEGKMDQMIRNNK